MTRAKKMGLGKGILLALAVILSSSAILLTGLHAEAGVVYQEGFEDVSQKANIVKGETVSAPGGQAWKATKGGDGALEGVFVTVPDLGVSSWGTGTIEFWIQRNEMFHREALFDLVDDNLKHLGVFQIYWGGFTQSNFPEIHIEASGYHTWGRTVSKPEWGGMKQFQTSIPFDRPVATGEWVHLAFTWGPAAEQCRILVNGSALPAGVKDPQAMSRLMSDARYLFVGMEVAGGQVWPPTEGWSLSASPIDEFRIHDTVETASALAPAAEIAWLNYNAAAAAGFSGMLVAGDIVTVDMEGSPRGTATFDVPRIAGQWGEIDLNWKGFGVYMEDKSFFEDDEINLRNVEEYRVYGSTEPIDLQALTMDSPFIAALEVEEQSYVLKEAIVPGEAEGEFTTESLMSGTPYYVAVYALMKDDSLVPVVLPKQDIAMTEVAGMPGTYQGTFTAGYGDVYPESVVIGRIRSGATAAVLPGEETFAIDARLNIDVATTPDELKADEKSTAEVTVTVTDANGDAVPDHEIRFLLATTSQYTGVVGGGAFAEETGAAIEMKRRFRSTTDLFGRVKATYTAGFAAKTAIIVARDMASNDTGAGYIKTYIEASADLVLEQELTEERSKALAGYMMTVTSSDEWLTADGESEARITAHVTLHGEPVEGHRVGFSISSGTGKIRTVSGTTGRDGKARAVYTAGTKIGIVTIEAIDHTIGLVGTVQIELRSDAPAKIVITLQPELLYADGRSTADVEVLVTDINDNPNDGVIVEYGILVGSGKLQRIEEVTDRKGISTAQYVAGRIPGRVTIGVTVRSTVPTDEELLAARELALAVVDYDFY